MYDDLIEKGYRPAEIMLYTLSFITALFTALWIGIDINAVLGAAIFIGVALGWPQLFAARCRARRRAESQSSI